MKLVDLNNNLYRGPRPSSFSVLRDAGMKSVINLQSGYYDEWNDDTYETENGFEFGIADHIVHCSDFFPPKKWQVKKAIDLITNSSGPTYIHCLHGKDRTGFMIAAYRIIVCKWPAERAINEMLSEGFHNWFYFWWKSYLRDLEGMEYGDL